MRKHLGKNSKRGSKSMAKTNELQVGDVVRINNTASRRYGHVGVLEILHGNLGFCYVRFCKEQICSGTVLFCIKIEYVEPAYGDLGGPVPQRARVCEVQFTNDPQAVKPRALKASWTLEDARTLKDSYNKTPKKIVEDHMKDELEKVESEYNAKIRKLKRERWMRASDRRMRKREPTKWSKTKQAAHMLILLAVGLALVSPTIGIILLNWENITSTVQKQKPDTPDK
ncbi:MAG: hypothetical protein ACTSYO_08190 [Candidatus Ranarchaeia archaeon]